MAGIIHLTAAAMPSPAMLLGTSGNTAVMEHINNGLHGSTYFGSIKDTFSGAYNHFIENIVRPIKEAGAAIQGMVTSIMNPDVIRPLTEFDHLKNIPPSMYLPIITYQPVADLLRQGRITGFGFDPEWLPTEDVYGRLISNGSIDDALLHKDADGNIPLVWEFWSTDPSLSFEELDAIEATREFVFNVLMDTKYDPTDYPEHRG